MPTYKIAHINLGEICPGLIEAKKPGIRHNLALLTLQENGFPTEVRSKTALGSSYKHRVIPMDTDQGALSCLLGPTREIDNGPQVTYSKSEGSIVCFSCEGCPICPDGFFRKVKVKSETRKTYHSH